MYVANHFAVPDEWIDRWLDNVWAGNLVTVHADGPHATLAPLYCERSGSEVVFHTHLVRNNPQVREPILGPGLVVIDIAHEYVSPAWYATNDALPSVPTWDYLTLHARGEVRIDPDPATSLQVAQELTRRMGEQWSTELIDQRKLELMARAIVAVEVQVTELQAKAKMSQNRHPDDVRSLIEHFATSADGEFTRFLRDVSLPHAQQRTDTITDLKNSGAVSYRLGADVEGG